ncbi:IS4 family transposase [Carnobacterium maltaromaticum]|uniref:IS4 family transposase n=1 Tax=Carnobacterium maltaromaticum TaxID=2751 RepID=UPI003B9818D3
MKKNIIKEGQYAMTQFKKFAEHISSCFSPSAIQEFSQKSKIVKRKRVFTTDHLLWLCVWQEKNMGDSSLIDMCASLWQQFGIKISPEGLNQRFNEKSTAFLKLLFHSILEKQTPDLAAIQHAYSTHFNRIRILDSTSFQLPNTFSDKYPGNGGSGKKASVKIHLEYDLTSGEFLSVHIGPGKNNDRQFLPLSGNSILPNDLCIRDLGYFKLADLANWHASSAYFLSRIKVNTTIYTLNSEETKKSLRFSSVELYQYLYKLNPGESTEILEVYLGQKRAFPSRLIIYRLTADQLKLRRKKQEKISAASGFDYKKKTITLSELNLFITNVPCSKLSLDDVSKFYSLRWQIELLFKTWKSYFKIHRAKTSKIERFDCQLYGRLISILLSTSLMFQMRQYLYNKQRKELSELKCMRMIYNKIEEIGCLIRKSANLTQLAKLLNKIFSTIDWLGTKCRRYEKPTVFNILFMPSF